MSHKILIIPGESFPTHQSFMTEVYSKEDKLFQSVFLMRTDGKPKKRQVPWNKAFVYLIPRYSKTKLINSVTTYFCMDIRYAWLIPYIVFKEKISIIQVRDLTFPLLVALILKLFLRKKVVYQKSYPHEYHNMSNLLKSHHKFPWIVRTSTSCENKVLHFFMRFCDAIFPITSHMAKNLQKDFGLPAQKMYPFGMGFNFDAFPEKNKDNIFFLKDSVKVVYAGTLEEAREFDILLRGIVKAKKMMDGRQLVFEFIGGTAEEINGLKDKAADFGILSNCHFSGWIDRDDVYRKIMNSHIGISWFGRDISYIDASPTKMMEYLALGIPIVAVETVAMHKEILRKTNAGVCCQVDADDVGRKIYTLVNDYDFYKKNALKTIPFMKENYSYSTMSYRVKEIYDGLSS